MVSVVVASHKVPAYSLLGKESLLLARRPRSVVPDTAVYQPDDLLGLTRFYSGDLGFGEGDIIRKDRLFTANNSPMGDLNRLAPEGKMLVSVSTDLVKSTANLIVPGTVVNAVVFIKGDMNQSEDKVLSPKEDPKLGGLQVVDKKNAEAAAPAEKGRDALPAVITLMIDGEDFDTAKALVEYNEKGSIYLLPIGLNGDIYLAAHAGN